MKAPELVLNFDEDIDKHYKQVGIETEVLQLIIANNLDRQSSSSQLEINFQHRFIRGSTRAPIGAEYLHHQGKINFSTQLYDHQYDFEGEPGYLDERLLHEVGHYIHYTNESFLKRNLYIFKKDKLSLAGGTLALLGYGVLASSENALLPVDKIASGSGLLAAGAGMIALEAAANRSLGPDRFVKWAYNSYQQRPQEVFAREFAEREIANLEKPLITLVPRT